MMSWSDRTREEQALLNPCFCSTLLWRAASGYSSVGGGSLSFEESFLILPFVLHRDTRELLPRSWKTSMPVWLGDNPMTLRRISTKARLLVPITKESLMFGGTHRLLRLEKGRVLPESGMKKTVEGSIRASSDEVRECFNRSEFVGKWFAQTGNAPTVLALIGVRP
ncbi:MAG: three component ABC system middle component [Pseudomonadota bacterium]